MSQLTLPPVAKSFYTFCKKCEADRYHRVLTHTSSTTAKIECEVCKSRKSYSLPKTGSAASAVIRKASSSTKVGASKTSSARSHTGQYENFLMNKKDVEAIAYNMKTQFKEQQKLNHPKFGIGFVLVSQSDKIEVLFSDEVRTLMHARV